MQHWLNHKYLSLRWLEDQKKRYPSITPFSHLELKDFLKKNKAKELLLELSKQKFNELESDLFKFMQSQDFSKLKNKTLQDFRNFLLSEEFRTYLGHLTKQRLKKSIDCWASLYQNTDYLLPHDDQLKGRKIAYMLYLSDLEVKDGGQLILFKTKNKRPIEEVKAILPQFNTFMFFTVTPKTFHEVDEVITNKQRIAVGGWFHG